LIGTTIIILNALKFYLYRTAKLDKGFDLPNISRKVF
jgi:hypothetical protein